MTDHVAPNTGNYTIGKGIVYWTPAGGVERDLGNCPAFEIEAEIEELDHYSSRSGVRTKDLVVVLEKSAVVRITMEEFNFENMQMALLGGAEEIDTDGNRSFEILATDLVRGQLRFVATNDAGPRWTYILPNVAFRPNAAIAGISEEWGALELEGEIQAVDGRFGTATLQDSAGTEALTV